VELENVLSKSPKELQKEKAEASFKRKEIQAREGVKAMAEYEAAQVAAREKTARLRELRLAKETADRDAAALAPPAPKPKPKTAAKPAAKTAPKTALKPAPSPPASAPASRAEALATLLPPPPESGTYGPLHAGSLGRPRAQCRNRSVAPAAASRCRQPGHPFGCPTNANCAWPTGALRCPRGGRAGCGFRGRQHGEETQGVA